MEAVYPAEQQMLTTIRVWPIATFILLLLCERFIIGYPTSLSSELLLDFLLTSLVLLLSLKRNSSINIIQNVIAGGVIFYYWLSVCVYSSINFTVTWDTIISNIQHFDILWNFVSYKLIAFTTLIIFMIFMLRNMKINIPMHRSSGNLICLEIFFVLTLSCVITRAYANQTADQTDAINLTTQSFTATSVNNENLKQLLTEFPSLANRTHESLNGGMPALAANDSNDSAKKNIIIVLSESLSGVDSKYANGLFDRLPQIDKIQKDGIVFNKMVANGKISNQGLAALLLGVIANRTGGYTSIDKQFPPAVFSANNVIAYAKKHGYQTIAITSNPPHWENAAAWFKQIGFDTVIGPDSEELRNAKRYTWNVPSDEYLYNVALKKAVDQNKPYLIFIETISMHAPYILPDQKYKLSNSPLRNQINYVDQTTYGFYNKLKAQHFFNNGLFVLLGDHRRFESFENAEKQNGNYAVWHERIVGTVVGKGIKPHSICSMPYTLADFNRLLQKIIDNQEINDKQLYTAKISTQIGIDTPLSITLADEKNGGYLIRSEKYKPLFVSIYGDVPLNKIPNDAYKKAVAFLMLNDLWIKENLN